MIKIPTALSSLGIPIERQPYTGRATQYVTFNLTHHGYSDWASGGAIQQEWVYAVHQFSKGNFEALAERIMKLLRAAGYSVSEGPEMYEEDTQFYHLVFEARCWDDAGEYAEEDDG